MARHYFIKKDGTIIGIESGRRFLRKGMGRRVSLPKISVSQQGSALNHRQLSHGQMEWQEVQEQMQKHKSLLVVLAIYCVALPFLFEFYPLIATVAVVLGFISLFTYFYFHPE